MSDSPFHVGEQRVQQRLGVRDAIEPWATRVVRPFMPDQHREFYTQLPFVVATARDEAGRPWATLLAGPPGFVQSPDDTGLVFATNLLKGDALEGSLTAGSELGLLGIELETRRRNRVNGTITETAAGRLRFEVGQAFGNCPQYITDRQWFPVDAKPSDAIASRHDRLDESMQAWIETADTFFIASGYHGTPEDGDDRAFGMDASHRGGNAGFVKVVDDRRIVFPDYAGNNHFNTIGNLVMDPRAGLLFVDFDNGSLLQITGTAEIDWHSDAVAEHPGAQRLVVIDIDRVVRLEGGLPLRWSDPAGSVRSLRVVRKVKESDDVVSLYFTSRDGGELPDFEAGQHLPIELNVEGMDGPVMRTYSLSNGPGQGHYRISVKRQPNGLVSNLLHDGVEEGDIVSARAPAGDFLLTHSGRPVVLISAGIGLTPMLSMLHQLAGEGAARPILFVHGARDGAHHPLSEEVRDLARRYSSVAVDIAYSRPRSADVAGSDYHRQGRIQAADILELNPNTEADFYLCGPLRFMSDLTEELIAAGVDPDSIHTETFGPSAA